MNIMVSPCLNIISKCSFIKIEPQLQLHIPSSSSLVYLLVSSSVSNALYLCCRTPISVFMISRSSGGLANIAKYGEEYRKDEESPINVLFHGYGHYDLLESFSEESCQK
jgi:hypothetical protein